MKKGFTLIEMLVVIGIIAILAAASIGGYSKMTKSAERARVQELVSNAATALTIYYQREGSWPQRMLTASASGEGRLDEKVALILAKKGYYSLSVNDDSTKLIGADRFGIVTPLALQTIKSLGVNATETSPVRGSAGTTIKDHVLYFAVDVDGDGIVSDVNVGGETINVRATAVVWCIGKSGGNPNNSHKPWGYSLGARHDDVYSWTPGQTKDAN